LNNMYKPAIIYQDLTSALRRGIVRKHGNVRYWNSGSYSRRTWYYRHIIRVGRNSATRTGMETTIPAGYDVLWLRCLNDRWETFNVSFLDGKKEDLGKYTCGYRRLNEISPDGGSPDSYWHLHMWLPIPVQRSGVVVIQAVHNNDDWISGIAFGKNIWHHARNSAVAYYWRLNGGSPIGWAGNYWYNDNLAYMYRGRTHTLMVPVVPANRDKLLYFAEHNNSWLGSMHTSVTVNGHPIERLRTTYSNPFAIHFNGKTYDRYLAAKIPKDFIPKNAHFIKVEISMMYQSSPMYFRECGTHDLE